MFCEVTARLLYQLNYRAIHKLLPSPTHTHTKQQCVSLLCECSRTLSLSHTHHTHTSTNVFLSDLSARGRLWQNLMGDRWLPRQAAQQLQSACGRPSGERHPRALQQKGCPSSCPECPHTGAAAAPDRLDRQITDF